METKLIDKQHLQHQPSRGKFRRTTIPNLQGTAGSNSNLNKPIDTSIVRFKNILKIDDPIVQEETRNLLDKWCVRMKLRNFMTSDIKCNLIV